jgi:hypothetical protein
MNNALDFDVPTVRDTLTAAYGLKFERATISQKLQLLEMTCMVMRHAADDWKDAVYMTDFADEKLATFEIHTFVNSAEALSLIQSLSTAIAFDRSFHDLEIHH